MHLFDFPDQIKGQIAMDTDTDQITPAMLRSAYLAINEAQDGRLPKELHEGMSNTPGSSSRCCTRP